MSRHILNFSALKGLTLTKIERGTNEDSNESLLFTSDDGRKFMMSYYQDCCAYCYIEEIHGDLDDLIGTPILMAEEVSSSEPTDEAIAKRKAEYEIQKQKEGDNFFNSCYSPNPDNDWKNESETWTFYKAATIKGSVTIRWYGSSNGYYSEQATFEELIGDEE